MDNFYRILGVNKSASQEEIKKRYRFLVKAYHPDRYQEAVDKADAEEELKKINTAYSVIGQEESRREYDRNPNYYQQQNKRRRDSNSETEDNAGKNGDEETKKILAYFAELLKKWGSSVEVIYSTKIVSKKKTELVSFTTAIVDNAKSISYSQKSETLSQIKEQIEIIIRISISIAFEYASNDHNLIFGKDQLLENSTAFLLVELISFINMMSDQEKQSFDIQKLRVIHELGVEFSTEMFTFGIEQFKVVNSNYKRQDNVRANRIDSLNYCHSCGGLNVTIKATYRKNIGMLLMRKYSKVSGEMCSSCHEKLFWNSFLTNIFLGWWGIISCLINPFLLIMNIYNYIGSWKIRSKTDYPQKSAMDWKLMIPLFLIVLYISISFLTAKTSLPTKNLNSSNSPGKPSSDLKFQTSTPKPSILYSDEFTNMPSGYLSVSYQDGPMMYWNNFNDDFSDGILMVDLLNQKGSISTGSGHIILWRCIDENNFYYVFINGYGQISVGKFVNNIHSFLYLSEDSISGTNQKPYKVIVSFIGSTNKIFVADKYITSITDSSITSGKIGLGVKTDGTNSVTAIFDNLVIYSAKEYSKVLPIIQNPLPTRTITTNGIGNFPKWSKTPTSPVKSNDKIIVTVVNRFSQPQVVYVEGILIWQIEPGETKTFRFQRGKWRIDICHPQGSFPCENYSYVDMNYPTLTYTIRNE